MTRASLLLLLLPACACAQFNTNLSPKTTAAFESYLAQNEPQANRGPRYGKLKAGEVLVSPAMKQGTTNVNDGMVHDWVGAILVPNATVDQALSVLQNYASYKTIYAPEIVDSRLLRRNGDQWNVYLKIIKTKVLTAVLNSEYDVVYHNQNNRWIMTSRSTRMVEVGDDGKELPAGTGRGFLWRLNAYWLIEERPEGVYLECRSISLSRDIPFALGFAVGPFVKSLPTDSLQATMANTARALNALRAAATPTLRAPVLRLQSPSAALVRDLHQEADLRRTNFIQRGA